jgi:hypothetical protein
MLNSTIKSSRIPVQDDSAYRTAEPVAPQSFIGRAKKNFLEPLEQNVAKCRMYRHYSGYYSKWRLLSSNITVFDVLKMIFYKNFR